MHHSHTQTNSPPGITASSGYGFLPRIVCRRRLRWIWSVTCLVRTTSGDFLSLLPFKAAWWEQRHLNLGEQYALHLPAPKMVSGFREIQFEFRITNDRRDCSFSFGPSVEPERFQNSTRMTSTIKPVKRKLLSQKNKSAFKKGNKVFIR